MRERGLHETVFVQKQLIDKQNETIDAAIKVVTTPPKVALYPNGDVSILSGGRVYPFPKLCAQRIL